MKGEEGTCSGLQSPRGKVVTIGAVLKGNPPSCKVEGQWRETGACKEKQQEDEGLSRREAAESTRGGKELASCQVGGTERASPTGLQGV